MMRRCWRVLGAIFTMLLAACGPIRPLPTPTPALLPLGPQEHSSGPAAQISSNGDALPGRLLFVSAGDLWLWQGSTGRQLTSHGDLTQPAWSPNGTRIACVQRSQSASDVLLLDADGTNPLLLTHNTSQAPLDSFERIHTSTWAFYPAWSPDGQQLAFAAQASPPAGEPAGEVVLALYEMPASAGGSKTQIYAADTSEVGRPVFAPDGSLTFSVSTTSPAGAQLL